MSVKRNDNPLTFPSTSHVSLILSLSLILFLSLQMFRSVCLFLFNKKDVTIIYDHDINRPDETDEDTEQMPSVHSLDTRDKWCVSLSVSLALNHRLSPIF